MCPSEINAINVEKMKKVFRIEQKAYSLKLEDELLNVVSHNTVLHEVNDVLTQSRENRGLRGNHKLPLECRGIPVDRPCGRRAWPPRGGSGG